MTNLQKMRESRNLTTKELSEKSGVSIKTIISYETGRKDINHCRPITALKLARALNCHVEDIAELDRIF